MLRQCSYKSGLFSVGLLFFTNGGVFQARCWPILSGSYYRGHAGFNAEPGRSGLIDICMNSCKDVTKKKLAKKGVSYSHDAKKEPGQIFEELLTLTHNMSFNFVMRL